MAIPENTAEESRQDEEVTEFRQRSVSCCDSLVKQMEQCCIEGVSPETSRRYVNRAATVAGTECVQEKGSEVVTEKNSGDPKSTAGKLRIADRPLGALAGRAEEQIESRQRSVSCDPPDEQMEECCIEGMTPEATRRLLSSRAAAVAGTQGVQEERSNLPIPDWLLSAFAGLALSPNRSGGSGAGDAVVAAVAEASCGACIERAVTETEPVRKDAARVSRDHALVTGATEPAARAEHSVLVSTKKTRKPPKVRCRQCKRKAGPAAIQCRCGGHFCGLHIYDWEHECDFDYRKMEAERIARANPRIVAPKIVKL